MSCHVGDLSLSFSCRVGEYFLPDRFVCELTFNQLSVGGLSHNVRKDPKMHRNYLLNIVQFCDDPPKISTQSSENPPKY